MINKKKKISDEMLNLIHPHSEDAYITDDELENLPNYAFIGRNSGGKLLVCYIVRSNYNFMIHFHSCELGNLHTVDRKSQIGINGTETTIKENHHFGLDKGIDICCEGNYDDKLANLSIGVPFDGIIPIVMIDPADAELAANGNAEAIDKIFETAAEISEISS